MNGKTILIIDDDPFVRQLLESMFSQVGAETLTAATGVDGLRLLFTHRPDLIILDIMMPEKSGWEVCEQIRELTTTPIIMLTSLNTEEAIVRALESGAVDFVTKPFSTRVFLARAKAAMRQVAPQDVEPKRTAVYQDNYLIIDLDSRQVVVKGERERLTKTEYKLLAFLVRHSGQVLTFDQILEVVWGPGYDDNIDYVHSYVSRLRRKLEPEAKEPRYLVSEHGVGYRFQPQQ
jgi:two-component system KDP operon response regulator KdpE